MCLLNCEDIITRLLAPLSLLDLRASFLNSFDTYLITSSLGTLVIFRKDYSVVFLPFCCFAYHGLIFIAVRLTICFLICSLRISLLRCAHIGYITEQLDHIHLYRPVFLTYSSKVPICLLRIDFLWLLGPLMFGNIFISMPSQVTFVLLLHRLSLTQSASLWIPCGILSSVLGIVSTTCSHWQVLLSITDQKVLVMPCGLLWRSMVSQLF